MTPSESPPLDALPSHESHLESAQRYIGELGAALHEEQTRVGIALGRHAELQARVRDLEEENGQLRKWVRLAVAFIDGCVPGNQEDADTQAGLLTAAAHDHQGSPT